jgi:hypothetical protein
MTEFRYVYTQGSLVPTLVFCLEICRVPALANEVLRL